MSVDLKHEEQRQQALQTAERAARPPQHQQFGSLVQPPIGERLGLLTEIIDDRRLGCLDVRILDADAGTLGLAVEAGIVYAWPNIPAGWYHPWLRPGAETIGADDTIVAVGIVDGVWCVKQLLRVSPRPVPVPLLLTGCSL